MFSSQALNVLLIFYGISIAHAAVAPTIKNTITKVDTTVGKTVRIDCHATGDPTPTVTWYKNGAQVAGQKTASLPPNIGLSTYIFTATLQNGGPYECRATNGVTDGSGNVITRTFVVTVVITDVLPTKAPTTKAPTTEAPTTEAPTTEVKVRATSVITSVVTNKPMKTATSGCSRFPNKLLYALVLSLASCSVYLAHVV